VDTSTRRPKTVGEAEDVIVDVGGGAGRISLPLALRCKEVINIDPSPSMGVGFAANAAQAGISNVRFVASGWPASDPPVGTVALVNHVTYLTQDIVPFISQLEEAGPRRVIITVTSPPPPSRHHKLFRLLYGESEEVVPGHVEVVNVLWQMGILPDVHVLSGAVPIPSSPTREAAIDGAISSFGGEQWALWPLGPDLETRLRRVFETHRDLFKSENGQFVPAWYDAAREVLITWRPGVDRQ
jgi:hypothetical protein